MLQGKWEGEQEEKHFSNEVWHKFNTLPSALGLQDQVTGMKSRLTSFHPKIQLWKWLLIWLNLFHGIAVVKPGDGVSGEGVDRFIYL